MRSRSATWITYASTVSLVASIALRAAAQIEFGQSTFQLASATEPVPAPPPHDTMAVPSSELTFEQSSPIAGAGLPQRPARTVPQRAVRPAYYAASPVEPQFGNRPHHEASAYANASAEATLNRVPQPMQIQPAPTPTPRRPRGKPFEAIQSDPAISPYLNLYRADTNQSTLSNYYALVRPQLDQIEANRKQAADLQRLHAQLQSTAQRTAAPQPAGGAMADGMTMPAHFMDTAQFYRRTRR